MVDLVGTHYVTADAEDSPSPHPTERSLLFIPRSNLSRVDIG
jgi:hypothetical protein